MSSKAWLYYFVFMCEVIIATKITENLVRLFVVVI